MSCANTAHVGDLGTTFRATVKDGDDVIPLGGSGVTLEFFFKGPDPEVAKTFTASLTTNGSDGKMEYITSDPGDLDVAGEWQWQAHVVLPSGDWKSEIRTFTVVANLV